ncbi:MAG: hypothetical protein M1151_03995 [Candidatus Thermoplasmatota archaeon]|nr:hypothetical protein [Candidatus Thermoplasmatota archaeon]MCL5785818.1 hypothetical protein [Candidatus Thermoplasmatota archaeon]
MEKKVHLWEVKCSACNESFQHIFVASDAFKPHIFNKTRMKCPKCGATKYDPVRALGKEPLEKWKNEHPDLNIESLPDHSYVEEL